MAPCQRATAVSNGRAPLSTAPSYRLALACDPLASEHYPGVTKRRSFKQINALLTDTEEAIQTDPDFQQLRIEHFLDMPNLNLTRADAQALYYYLRAASPRRR